MAMSREGQKVLRHNLTRRQTVQLSAVVAGGWGLSKILRFFAPVGHHLVEPLASSKILQDKGSPASGPRAANLRLAVFTDYRCPACRSAYPELKAALRVDGHVSVIYKDWPIFGPLSEKAARVALASADQGIYEAVHGRLMTDGRVIDDDVLRDIVVASGGNWLRIKIYLAEKADSITARLQLNGEQALSIGLPGTPGYLAGQMLVIGARSRSEFTRLFGEARTAAHIKTG